MINGPIRSGDHFLFYGLLKQGAAGSPAHIDLAGSGEFLGPCRFKARLVDLGGYPGAVEGVTLCKGELYRLDDAGLGAALDDFEGVVAGKPGRSLYQRRPIAVRDEAGRETGKTAWIYWYARPVDGAPEVENGDWPLKKGRARA